MAKILFNSFKLIKFNSPPRSALHRYRGTRIKGDGSNLQLI